MQVWAKQRAKLADRVDSEIQFLLLPSGAGFMQATAQPVQQSSARKTTIETTVAATDCHPCIGPLYNGYPTWLVARVHCELPPGVHGLGPYQDLLVKAKRFDFHKQTAIDVDFSPTLPEPHQAIPVASHLAPLSYMQASHLRMPSETTWNVESSGSLLAEENAGLCVTCHLESPPPWNAVSSKTHPMTDKRLCEHSQQHVHGSALSPPFLSLCENMSKCLLSYA